MPPRERILKKKALENNLFDINIVKLLVDNTSIDQKIKIKDTDRVE